MAEKMRDREDDILQSLFASAPIADDGFSQRTLRRLRRKLWVNRLALPVAVVVGLAFAAQPAMHIVSALPTLAGLLPEGLSMDARTLVPSTPLLMIAALILVGVLGTSQLADD